jgi:hypothetical protein
MLPQQPCVNDVMCEMLKDWPWGIAVFGWPAIFVVTWTVTWTVSTLLRRQKRT